MYIHQPIFFFQKMIQRENCNQTATDRPPKNWQGSTLYPFYTQDAFETVNPFHPNKCISVPDWFFPMWSSWSEWSKCSAPCNSSIANRTRTRNCLNSNTLFYIPVEECQSTYAGEIDLDIISCGAGDCIEGAHLDTRLRGQIHGIHRWGYLKKRETKASISWFFDFINYHLTTAFNLSILTSQQSFNS